MPLSRSLCRADRSAGPPARPSKPYQFTRMARFVVGCAMIAGVHSTVWIFAISAAMIRRARVVQVLVDQLG